MRFLIAICLGAAGDPVGTTTGLGGESGENYTLALRGASEAHSKRWTVGSPVMCRIVSNRKTLVPVLRDHRVRSKLKTWVPGFPSALEIACGSPVINVLSSS